MLRRFDIVVDLDGAGSGRRRRLSLPESCSPQSRLRVKMLSDILRALEIIREIYGIYEQLKEGDVLSRRLCERVQLFTNFLEELQTKYANSEFQPTASMRDSVVQLAGVLNETKDFLTKNSINSKSVFGPVRRIFMSLLCRNKFTDDLNSLNQRINDCISNLLPSQVLNSEEQRRLDTEDLKNQTECVVTQMEQNIGDKLDGVLLKILDEINLSRDEKQKRQELLKRVLIPPRSRVEVIEGSVLGMGGFGTVYLGSYDAAKVAIKSLHSAKGKEIESVENEVLLMNYLGSHPTILTCYGIWRDTRGLTSIVLDYSPYGSLVDLLNDFDNFPEFSVRLQVGWAIDLINALDFIHQKKVKHRDVKADNLLVFSELKVKLCDFGLSKQHSLSRKSSIVAGGTVGFIAPEVNAGDGSGLPSDIFSWAMTFYQIVMREHPKVALSHSQLIGNLLVELKDKLDGVDLGVMSSLLTNCIHKNPESRPLACDINEFM